MPWAEEVIKRNLYSIYIFCFVSYSLYEQNRKSLLGPRRTGRGRLLITVSLFGLVEIQWRQPYISAIPGREERWVSGTPLPASVASAASCRLLPQRRQKAGGQQHVPIDILTKCQDSPCENRANGRGAGTERECANHTRPRECRGKAESRFSRHFAARHGTPCCRNPSPASVPRGERLAKGQTGVACSRTSSRAGNAFRSPVFPFFMHSQELLCGKKVSPLRKAVHFFAESDSVFTAEKRPQGRRNAPYKQFLHPVFNSPALVCSRSSCH